MEVDSRMPMPSCLTNNFLCHENLDLHYILAARVDNSKSFLSKYYLLLIPR